MKIVSIKFLNLNSLKGTHEIRFDQPPFTDSGLFAIIGPTGAGKTTLLDAITIALYGQVHRHDKEDPSEIMTRHTGESFSEVEFEVRDKTYRAKWSNYRARKKAEGKLQGVRMELSDAATGDLIVAHPLPEVQRSIIQVCGLDYNQFIRSVMLSQGDFTRFLKANENDRSDLLEKITDTSIYSEISSWVFREARNKSNQLTELRARLHHVTLLGEEELAAHHAALQDLTSQLKLHRKRRDETAALQQWLVRIGSLKIKQQQLTGQYQLFDTRYKTNQPRLDRLALHQQAMKHRQLFDQTEAGRKQVDDTAGKLAEIAAALPALQQQLDLLYTQIEEANSGHDKARTAMQDAMPVIAEVERKDVLIESTTDQVLKDQEIYDDAQASLIETEKETGENEEALKRSEQEIKKLTRWLAQHQQEAELEKAIPVFSNLLEKLEELHGQSTARTQEKSQLSIQKDGIKKALLQLQQEAAGHQQAGDASLQLLQKSAGELQTALAGRALEDWETEAADFPSLINRCEQQHQLAEQIRQLEKNNTQTAEKEVACLAQQAKEKEALGRFKEELASSEALLHIMQKNVALQILVQKYEADRKALQQDTACPLCGSVHHPYVENNYTNERTAAEGERDEQQQAVAALLKSVSDREAAVRGLQTDLEKSLRQKEQTTLDLAAARQEFGENNRLLPRPLEAEKPAVIELVIARKREEYSRLKQIIQQIRITEKRIKEQEAAISRLKEKEAATGGEISKAHIRLEHSEASAHRVEQELASFLQAEKETAAKTTALLQRYGTGVEQTPGKEILQQLRERAALFAATQASLQQQQIAFGKLQSDVRHAHESIAEKTIYIQRLGSLLSTGKKRLLQLQEERFELFGEKEPTEEKKRLEKDVSTRRNTVEELTRKLGESNQAWKIAESQQTEWTGVYRKQQQDHENLFASLTAQLRASNIASVEALQQQFLAREEAEQIESACRRLEKEKTDLQRSLYDNETELSAETEKELTQETMDTLTGRIADLENTISGFDQEIGRIQEKLNADKKYRTQHEALAGQLDIQQKDCERWNSLSELIGSDNGKKFSRFAQGLTLARLTELANRHLLKLSDRYRIIKSADKDLELLIIDGYQADVIRPMSTLSGGESFLVSLALALGLSDLASRKVQIHSLFIDEGFGTLDAETLDTAISALENLQANGKTIGVISHVEALKERIGTQIQLTKQPGGSSQIKIVGYHGKLMG